MSVFRRFISTIMYHLSLLYLYRNLCETLILFRRCESCKLCNKRDTPFCKVDSADAENLCFARFQSSWSRHCFACQQKYADDTLSAHSSYAFWLKIASLWSSFSTLNGANLNLESCQSRTNWRLSSAPGFSWVIFVSLSTSFDIELILWAFEV